MRGKAAHLIARLEERMSAAQAAHADEPSVHDLRTGIRRLSECLRAFESVFPQGQADRVRRRLRKLMTLAAEVRNRDIAGDLLAKAGVASDDPAFERLRREQQECHQALAEKLASWTGQNRPKRWRARLKAV